MAIVAADNILYCCVVTRENFRVGVLNFDIDTVMCMQYAIFRYSPPELGMLAFEYLHWLVTGDIKENSSHHSICVKIADCCVL